MRRVFKLTHPKKKVERLVDAARADINKHLKRERKKELPKGVDFWNFVCRCGADADSAVSCHIDDLGKQLDAAAAANLESVFVEITTTEGVRTKKPSPWTKPKDL